MNRPRATLVRAAALGLTLPLLAGLSTAAPDDRSDGADPPALDVRATCPGLDRALQDQLGPFHDRHPAAGVVQVFFRLDGDRISEIRIQGPLRHYRAAIHRAVRGLQCQGPRGGRLYLMELSFRMPDDGTPPRAAGLR